jgi:sec-independent protein translocase protein TatA
MPSLGAWEWLIIAAIILLLFGAKRLPDAARGLGRSLRIFKAETKGLTGPEQPATGEISASGGATPGSGSGESPHADEAPTAPPRDRSED